jgi:DNA-binding SARP family transcriptional activator
MTASRLRLLGAFALETAFSPAPLHMGRKAQALLAAVALQGSQGLSRTRLISLLWGEHGEEEARGALRQCLHLLRRSLGTAADLLEIDGERLVVAQHACEVDVIRFESLAASRDLADWGTAAAIYRGDFIEALEAGPDFELWAAVERERLRNLAHGVLSRLSHQTLDGATREQAEQLAHRLLASDRVHEGCYRALMRLYAAAGLRAKALQTWNECRETLRRELDVEPSDETAAVIKRLRGHAAVDSAPPASAPTPVPFVPVVSPARSGDDPRVVDLNLRGWEQYVLYTPDGNLRARAAFEEAVRLAGDHAEVIARVGWTYWTEATSRWTGDPDASMAQAFQWASRAIACNRGRSTPHSLMGKVLLWRGQHDVALQQFRAAVELEPHYSWAHFHLAEALMWAGQCDEALAEVSRALALDQNDHGIFLNVRGFALWMMRENRAARLALHSALTRNPTYFWPALMLAVVDAEEGDLAAAADAAATALGRRPRFSVSYVERALPFRMPEHRRRMVDALRACGMPEDEAAPPHMGKSAPEDVHPGLERASPGNRPWIAGHSPQ